LFLFFSFFRFFVFFVLCFVFLDLYGLDGVLRSAPTRRRRIRNIHNRKAGLVAEAEARAAEDDHLAASLAAYVQKLQISLTVVNSDDATF
jgi:hypothetical protein